VFGTGSILDAFASIIGVLAGSIAVGGFLGHVRPGLGGHSDRAVRRATVEGGLAGLSIGVLVVVLSALVS
jgi:hypothetical protein